MRFDFPKNIAFHLKNIVILAVRKAGHLNINAKIFDFEARVLIGWLANTLANQNACIMVKPFCFYVMVACLSYGEYSFHITMYETLPMQVTNSFNKVFNSMV